MPGIFSRLKGKDSKKRKGAADDLANALPSKPTWDDAWTRTFVEPEEIHELLHFCTEELKARGTTPTTEGGPCELAATAPAGYTASTLS
jgi:hypothetical protein